MVERIFSCENNPLQTRSSHNKTLNRPLESSPRRQLSVSTAECIMRENGDSSSCEAKKSSQNAKTKPLKRRPIQAM